MTNLLIGLLVLFVLCAFIGVLWLPLALTIEYHSSYFLLGYLILIIPLAYGIGKDINKPKKRRKTRGKSK